MGPSSLGKSTALMVAGSVHRGGGVAGYIKSWRSTTNGLEGLAAVHSDTLLCLDELGQVQAEDAAEAAYMLANGTGKARANKDGSARQKAEWRLIFLSSGEISLADRIAEIRGRRRTAGQGVRLVDIQADARQGLGLFETLHEFPSADAFATHLRSASATVYGTAGPAFIEALVGTQAAIAERVKAQIDAFVATVPPDADGQVLRVARRFGLVAAAGELGISLGILPWPPEEASFASKRLFDEWIAARGGYEGAEVRDAIERLRDFIAAHGSTRFQSAWSREEGFRPPHQGLAGYRKRASHGWEFYILPGTWNQILQGLSTVAVADALIRLRLLLPPGSGRHRSKSISIPGSGKQRVYHLAPEIIQDDAE